jgi:hypothetical protein
VVVTSEKISFALATDEIEMDFIPLQEITKLEILYSSEGMGGTVGYNGGSQDPELFDTAFQIATSPDGHNSGRTYYLRAESRQERQHLLLEWQRLAHEAAHKMEQKTRFRLVQDSVRRVYLSNPFQGFAAALIIAVCTCLQSSLSFYSVPDEFRIWVPTSWESP